MASPRNMFLPGLIALNLPHLQKPGPWQPAISVIRRRKIMASSSVKLPAPSLFLWKYYCIISRCFSYMKCVVSVVRTPNYRGDPYLFSLSSKCLPISYFCAIVHSAVQCVNVTRMSLRGVRHTHGSASFGASLLRQSVSIHSATHVWK